MKFWLKEPAPNKLASEDRDLYVHVHQDWSYVKVSGSDPLDPSINVPAVLCDPEFVDRVTVRFNVYGEATFRRNGIYRAKDTVVFVRNTVSDHIMCQEWSVEAPNWPQLQEVLRLMRAGVLAPDEDFEVSQVESELCCALCRRPRSEVKKLITATDSSAVVCGDCVQTALAILAEDAVSDS